MPRRALFGSIVAIAALRGGAVAQTSEPVRVENLVRSGPCVMSPIAADAPRYRVTGSIIDDLTGAPIAHATVRLAGVCRAPKATGQAAQDHWPVEVVSDDDGKFVIENVPAMAVNLTASQDGYQEVWPFRRTANDPIGTYNIGSDTDPITLRLAPAPSISGVMRGSDGAPLAHAWVTLWCYHTWAGWRRLDYCNSLETAADGSYRFGPLQPGRYALVAQAWLAKQEPPKRDAQGRTVGYVPVRYPTWPESGADSFMDLAEGQQARVDFELQRQELHHITGRVSGREQWPPIIDVVDRSGSKSYIIKMGLRCCGFEAWVPSGRFRLESQFTSGDGEFIGSMAVAVTDEDIEGIVFPLGRRTSAEIPIKITAAPANNADAIIQAWYLQLIDLKQNGYVETGPQSTLAGWMRATGASRTESISVLSGSHAVALTTSGNVYAQSISSGGTDLIRESLMVNPDQAPDMICVVVAEGALVEGVTRREGSSVRAWVYAVPEQADARLLQAVASDADGKFRLEGLAPARYLFFACDVEVPLDVHNASEISRWQRRGQSLTLQAGKTASLELQVNVSEDSRVNQ